MLPYIFHVSLLLAVCYLLYRTLWEKETYFQLNRWILITCLLLSFGLPSLTVPENWSLQKRVVQQKILVDATPERTEPVNMDRVITEPSIYVAEGDGEKVIIPEGEFEKMVERESEEEPKVIDNQSFAWAYKLSIWQIIQYVYIGGLIIFSLNFLIQLMLIIFQRQTNPKLKDGRFTIVEINQDKAPFSFGNSIFINPTKYDWDTYNQILDHEKIHIEQRHTLDIILAELVVIMQWFNPFAWFYRKAVENNLEYLTDYKMLHQGTEPEVYQLNLLRVSVPQLPLNLTTNYNQSFLKKRIAMMNVKKSSASSSWKYLLLLPLLALTVITLNPVQLQSQTDPQKKTKKKKDKGFWYKAGSENVPPPPPPAPPSPPAVSAPPSPPAPPTPPPPGSVQSNRHTSTTTYSSTSDEQIVPVPPVPPAPPGYITNHTVTKSTISGDAWTREEVIGVYKDGVNVNGSVEFDDKDNIMLHSGVLKINGEVHRFNMSGEWKGKIEEDIQVCLKLYSDTRFEGRSFALGFCDRDWSPSPTKQKKGPYTLTQGAGVLTLEGEFDDRRGRGDYSFKESADFRNYLSKEGYSRVDENLMFHFFIANIDQAFFKFLKKEGYAKLSKNELEQLAYHRMSRAKLEDYITTLKKLDFDKPSIKELTQLAIHDIDPDYIGTLGRDLYKDLTLNEVVQAAIHDIDPDYIRSISESGYDNLNFEEIVQFAIHDIDTEYIKELKGSGMNLTRDQIVQAGIHNIDADFIKEMQEMVFAELDFNDIIQFGIHDIDSDYIRDLKEAGLDNLSKDQIVQAGIHNIDANYIKEMQEMVFAELDFNDIVQFGIHDIDAEYVQELKEAGLDDLSKDQIVQAGIHNINARDLAEFKKLGFDDLSFSDIIQLGIHDIDAGFVEGLRGAGFPNISIDQIVQAGIHDVDTDDVEAYRKLGFDKLTIRELVKLSIHNVTPRFIKKVQDSGTFKDLDIDDYIDMKIHGIDKKMRRQE